MTTKERTELEGLAREVALPDVTSLADILNLESVTHGERDTAPQPTRVRPLMVGDDGPCELDPFVWVELDGKLSRPSTWASPTKLATDALQGCFGLTLNIHVIDHRNGWSLVTADYNRIIGGHWLAYVTTDSVRKTLGLDAQAV